MCCTQVESESKADAHRTCIGLVFLLPVTKDACAKQKFLLTENVGAHEAQMTKRKHKTYFSCTIGLDLLYRLCHCLLCDSEL